MAQDDRRLAALPKRRYSYSSESEDGGRINCLDRSDTVFATFSTPNVKKGKCTQKKEIEPVERLSVPSYFFVPDREPDFLTDGSEGR